MERIKCIKGDHLHPEKVISWIESQGGDTHHLSAYYYSKPDTAFYVIDNKINMIGVDDPIMKLLELVSLEDDFKPVTKYQACHVYEDGVSYETDRLYNSIEELLKSDDPNQAWKIGYREVIVFVKSN